MKEIYTDLLYVDSINVKGMSDEKIFTNEGFDPTNITIKEFLWCANGLSNSRDISDGVELLISAVNIASYYINKKETNA